MLHHFHSDTVSPKCTVVLALTCNIAHNFKIGCGSFFSHEMAGLLARPMSKTAAAPLN